jgi:hypothetical protein
MATFKRERGSTDFLVHSRAFLSTEGRNVLYSRQALTSASKRKSGLFFFTNELPIAPAICTRNLVVQGMKVS